MEYILIILGIFGIHISAWLTPWPTFLLLFRNALMYGQSVIVWNAFGVFCSNIIHTSYAILVLTMITGFAEQSMFWIQILWSTYLIYLWLKTIFHSRKIELHSKNIHAQKYSSFELFREAFFTNLLSPKASIFFLSIFSLAIEKNPPPWALITLWIGLPINSFLFANAVWYIVSRETIRTIYIKYSKLIGTILGIVMIILGLLLFINR